MNRWQALGREMRAAHKAMLRAEAEANPSTVRSRRAADRAKRNRRDPVSYINAPLRQSQINAMALFINDDQLHSVPMEGKQWHDAVAAMIPVFVAIALKTLKRRD